MLTGARKNAIWLGHTGPPLLESKLTCWVFVGIAVWGFFKEGVEGHDELQTQCQMGSHTPAHNVHSWLHMNVYGDRRRDKKGSCLDYSFLWAHSVYKVRENLMQTSDFEITTPQGFRNRADLYLRPQPYYWSFSFTPATFWALKVEHPIESSSQRCQACILVCLVTSRFLMFGIWRWSLT